MADNTKKNDNNPRNADSSLFKQLTKLLSGPIINRRTQIYRQERRVSLDKYAFKFKSASGKEFKKSQYNPFESIQTAMSTNYNRGERYAEFDQMEYCLHPDTKIAVPGGYKTIKELSVEYGIEKEFIVYSYDHNKKQIVPAIAKQARKTTTDHAWKVTFENGQEIIGTSNHRLMMRDGTYRTIEQLNIGDSLMPFYRKDLIKTKQDSGEGYRWIYTMHNDSGRKKGWIAEHILMAEWAAGRRLKKNEVVHHINFIKNDNNPENLVIMDNDEHLRYHQNVLNEQKRNDPGLFEEVRKRHSQWMKENNPAERKDITFELILSLCDQYGFNQKNICKMLDTDPNTIKRRLNSKGFESFTQFARTYNTEWKNEGQNNNLEKNPRYDNCLSFMDICNAFERGISSNKLAKKLNTSYVKIINRLKQNGYTNYSEFVENYTNHKVKSVEYYGFIDLYDLTVDGYKNFATDSVISHNTPEIASALDIYADEMTTSSTLESMMVVECPNAEIKEILNNLYFKVLNVDFNLFGWSRNMCKYGDFFLYLDIDEELGVKNVIGLPGHEVERLEGEDETNPNYIQYQWNSAGMTFENWQIAHFRILGNDKYNPYGTSVLEPARRIWRQLTLLEDAMMAYRIVRSPERRVFYIDVGNVDPQDVEQYMQKVMTTMKRNQVVDPETGRVDLRYNPLSIEEDYFLPVRGSTSNSKIDTLAGGTFTGDIDDVKYLRDKLFSALKIPQSYLSRGEGADEDKATLAQKDIRFARTIQRLQRSIISELEKVGIIHLYTLGYKGDDLISHKLYLNNPSRIAELQELEYWKTKFDVASSATENFFSKRWIAKNLFGLSDEEFVRNQQELFYDREFSSALEQAGQPEEEASASGGGIGGGIFGAEETPTEGGAEVEPPLEGETPPEGEEGPELDDTGEPADKMLVAPAKREDGMTTTPRSKGKWYKPVTTDMRNSGARLRSYLAHGGSQTASSSKRNVVGSGALELIRLGNGVFEKKQHDEEQQILETNNEVKTLLENLKSSREKEEKIEDEA